MCDKWVEKWRDGWAEVQRDESGQGQMNNW